MEYTNHGNLRKWLIPVCLIGILGLYFLVDPMESRYMPQCIFYHITGIKCMGCGTQRMLHALLHGDLGAAFRANALVTMSLPFLALLLWLELTRKRHPRLYARIYSTYTIWGIALILFVWFIVRNIIGI